MEPFTKRQIYVGNTRESRRTGHGYGSYCRLLENGFLKTPMSRKTSRGFDVLPLVLYQERNRRSTKMRQLAFNVRQVFDYLCKSKNSAHSLRA